MWVDKKVYQHYHDEWVKCHEEARVLSQQNLALHTTMDWMRMRVNQLEHERAMLIQNYMGVKIEVPTIRSKEDVTMVPPTLGGRSIFDDMGDAAAKAEGVAWDDSGKVVYR